MPSRPHFNFRRQNGRLAGLAPTRETVSAVSAAVAAERLSEASDVPRFAAAAADFVSSGMMQSILPSSPFSQSAFANCLPLRVPTRLATTVWRASLPAAPENGRAPCRERVCQNVTLSGDAETYKQK